MNMISIPLAVVLGGAYLVHDGRHVQAGTLIAGLAGIAAGLIQLRYGALPPGALDLLLSAVVLYLWWRDGRGSRKRAAALIGAKSRALRAALVARLARERRVRPVLVPQS